MTEELGFVEIHLQRYEVKVDVAIRRGPLQEEVELGVIREEADRYEGQTVF